MPEGWERRESRVFQGDLGKRRFCKIDANGYRRPGESLLRYHLISKVPLEQNLYLDWNPGL